MKRLIVLGLIVAVLISAWAYDEDIDCDGWYLEGESWWDGPDLWKPINHIEGIWKYPAQELPENASGSFNFSWRIYLLGVIPYSQTHNQILPYYVWEPAECLPVQPTPRVPTPTNTQVPRTTPTNTPLPPTSTPVLPTATLITPTATSTPTPTVTSSPEPTSTATVTPEPTDVPPTDTPEPIYFNDDPFEVIGGHPGSEKGRIER